MKLLAVFKYGFTLIGLGLVAIAFSMYSNTHSFLDHAVTTEGTVTQLVRSYSSQNSGSSSYFPVIRFFTPDGNLVEFQSSTGSNPPAYSTGELVEVLYRPEAPERARINSFSSLWGATLVVGGIGLAFFLTGFSIILAGSLGKRKANYLLQHGTPINSQFQGVEQNTAISMNGRHPYRVLAQWQNPATSEVHVFRSRNLWFDPTSYLQDNAITVYLDKDNPKKYYMDLSFLPKLAN